MLLQLTDGVTRISFFGCESGKKGELIIMAYNHLTRETQRDYSATKAALRERFEPPNKCQLHKVEFEIHK